VKGINFLSTPKVPQQVIFQEAKIFYTAILVYSNSCKLQ